MKSEIKNTHSELIRLFVKKDGVEQQVDIPAGESVIVDDYETRTIILFRKRGFITMSSIEPSKGNETSDAVKSMDTESGPSNEAPDAIRTDLTSEKEDFEGFNDKLFSAVGVPKKYFNTNDATVEPESVSSHSEDKLYTASAEVEQYVEDGFIKGEWSEDEVTFLRKHYPKEGRKYCSSHLNRNETSVQKKITSLGLKKKNKKRKRRR